jgi:hypothetical protein
MILIALTDVFLERYVLSVPKFSFYLLISVVAHLKSGVKSSAPEGGTVGRELAIEIDRK